MGLEAATYISQLTATNPVVGDNVSQGDDHIRLLKTVLQAQFPNLGAAAVTATAAELNIIDGVTASTTELNYVDGVTSAIQTQLDAKVPLATSGRWVPITDTTITGTPSSVDFTSSIDSTYDEYMVTFSSVKPSTDPASLWMRTSTNAGSSYDSAGSDYAYSLGVFETATSSETSSAGEAQILIGLSVGGAANEEGVSGHLYFWAPSSAKYLRCQWSFVFLNQNGAISRNEGVGVRLAAADVDAIRFMFSTGTMASGRIKLFGRKV